MSRPANSLRLYTRILRYLIPYWPYLAGVLGLNLFYVLFNAISIWMVAPFLTTLFGSAGGMSPTSLTGSPTPDSLFDLNDQLKSIYLRWVSRDDPRDALQVICILIFLTFLLKNIFQFFEAYLVSFVEQRVIKDLRDTAYEKLLYKPLRFFAIFGTGNLISRVTNDINALNVAVNRSFTKVIRDPLMIIIFAGLLVSIDWKLTVFASVVIPLSGFAIHRIGLSLKRRTRQEQERIAEVTARLQDTFTGVKVVQAFSQENEETARFREVTRRHFVAVLRKVRLNRLSQPLSETLGVVIMVAVLWYGGRRVLSAEGIPPEDFVRFLAILFAILEPIKSLGNLHNNIQIAAGTAVRVFEVMDHPLEIAERPNPVSRPSFDTEIRYENVSFRYEEAAPWALREVSLTIAREEKVALVGRSGSGKSTLTNLLPRFYDPVEGRIVLDGHDLRDLKLKDLRRLIGMVTQEVVLFNDTVASNIAYGMPDVSRGEIELAAEMANALGFIRQLPDGLDTVIGERGLRLSGGERQRLSIARAVLLDPPILIFDEATSSLDSESERLIQDATIRLLRQRTVLMIAHRLSSIIHADKIVVMDAGRIVDVGRHEELLERSKIYRMLYRLQYAPQTAEERKPVES